MFGNAEAYERFMGRWSRLLAPLLIDFAGIPEGKILDVGSGTGTLTFAIAERKTHCQITGIDPSEEYIRYAISRNPFPDRTTFEVGDAQRLNFANAAFKASASLLVFSFIGDPLKALRELLRVTEPNGRISAAVWDYGARMRMLRTFWDAAASIDPRAERLDEKHMPLCREGELAAMWKECGLKSVSEKPLEITMHFLSFNDYWDAFLLGQGPAGAYVRAVHGDRMQLLRSAVKNQLSISNESSAFTLPARAWAVRGTVPTHLTNSKA
jgi:ubiquinone/menaquinone biosynthesis C-methylase UbiE